MEHPESNLQPPSLLEMQVLPNVDTGIWGRSAEHLEMPVVHAQPPKMEVGDADLNFFDS
jgi:hypothetical protein